MRTRPWLGSVAVHVAIGAVWLGTRRDAPVTAPPAPRILVEVIAPAEVPATTTLLASGGVPLPPAVEQPPARKRSTPVPRAHAPVVRAAPIPATPDEPVAPPVPDQPAVATSPVPAHAAVDAPGAATPAAPIAPEGARGTTTPPAPADPIAKRPITDAVRALLDRPAGAPQIKPRSPRLISRVARPRGTRGQTVEDTRQFVVLLTIDTDGSVIGARLKRGPPGHRQDRAMAAVWRFRYHPAVDGDGHAIVSRVEQRFVVE